MAKMSWKETCVWVMQRAEITNNKTLQKNIEILGRQAIKENITIYEKMMEMVLHYQKIQNTTSSKR